MNSRTRAFAKQVQIDLLALSDANLFYTIHQWMDELGSASEYTIPEDSRLALGYTCIIHNSSPSPLLDHLSDTQKQWLAPTPNRLRELLSEMNLKLFIQHVIPIAFQSLHTTYPEWGEGSTFNAHLANHLRGISKNQLGLEDKELPENCPPVQ
jgi:hypothetical protein